MNVFFPSHRTTSLWIFSSSLGSQKIGNNPVKTLSGNPFRVCRNNKSDSKYILWHNWEKYPATLWSYGLPKQNKLMDLPLVWQSETKQGTGNKRGPQTLFSLFCKCYLLYAHQPANRIGFSFVGGCSFNYGICCRVGRWHTQPSALSHPSSLCFTQPVFWKPIKRSLQTTDSYGLLCL